MKKDISPVIDSNQLSIRDRFNMLTDKQRESLKETKRIEISKFRQKIRTLIIFSIAVIAIISILIYKIN